MFSLPDVNRCSSCRHFIRLLTRGYGTLLFFVAALAGYAPVAVAEAPPRSPQPTQAAAGPVAAPAGSPERPQDLERAQRLLGQGSIEEAVAVLRDVVRTQPGDADAHLLLGRALALVPEPTRALAALRRAVELRPSSAEAHYTLATALARFGELAPARAAFERAIALDPASADAHVNLALLLAQADEPGAAREHLARAIEIQGQARGAAYAHYLMAQILREEGDTDAALQHLAAAIQIRPTYADAYLSQGLIRSQLRDERGALQAFEAAVRLTPDDAVSRSQLGAAYLRHGQAEAAIPHLQHARQLQPADRSTLYHLCRALRLAGHTREAEGCAQQLSGRLEAESGESDLAAARANNEGVALEAKGSLPAALERYRLAVTLNPSNTVFRRNAALALCRLGRWHEGVVELRTVLEVDPNDQDATRALYIAMEQIRTGQRP